MNDLGEDGWAGTPSMCSKMWTYPSLFTPWPLFPPLHKSFIPRKSCLFVAPIVLVMEHFEKTIHAHCQRVFVCRMKSLPPLPPRPITVD